MDNHYVLSIQDLYKQYPIPRGIVGSITRQEKKKVHAIDGISVDLKQGEILALVGESGSGKTTTGLCALGLETPTKGKIMLDGEDMTELLTRKRRKELRRKAQIIFQDPYESLNPRQTIYEAIVEPLKAHHIGDTQEERTQIVKESLEAAGLKPAESFFDRYPEELSGGQRQRVVIACGLVLRPQLLVADEPVSMLDVSIRAEILNLLLKLRNDYGITIIYITHDLATAAYVADKVAVMYLGVIVEYGPADKVLYNPYHPYTKALMSVIPVPNPCQREKRQVLKGETPDPVSLPSGCRFHPRCPIAIEDCSRSIQEFRDIEKDHFVMCQVVNLRSEN